VQLKEKETFIRQKSSEHSSELNEKIYWSLHAVKKARLESLKVGEIEDLLKDCTAIEDYAMERRPLPGCLVLGFAGSSPVHAVIAIDKELDRILIVTVYKPSPDRWDDGWKKRKPGK
jgi:hypothetical protein